MTGKTILITGGTGLIGTALSKALLDKGHSIIILTRQVPNKKPGITEPVSRIQYANWDIKNKTIDESAICDSDYIIHLAGAGVAEKRWTKKRKQEIISSRVDSSKLIVDSLQKIPNHVKAVISASAIGWYGPDPVVPNPHPFEEDRLSDESFLGTTCFAWEQSIKQVTSAGKRLVLLRTGIVLSKDGGALKEFLNPLRYGVATILGNGKQVISWIHMDDLVRMYMTAIEDERFSGIYNAVAPHPVSNKEFILQLARMKKGKFFIPLHVPSFVLRIVLGEMSIEVLKSATVSSSKIQVEGFEFLYPHLHEALHQLIP